MVSNAFALTTILEIRNIRHYVKPLSGPANNFPPSACINSAPLIWLNFRHPRTAKHRTLIEQKQKAHLNIRSLIGCTASVT